MMASFCSAFATCLSHRVSPVMLPLLYACNGVPQVPASLSMKLQAAHFWQKLHGFSYACSLIMHSMQTFHALYLMPQHGVKPLLLFHFAVKRQPAEFRGPDYFFLAEAGFALPFLFFLSAAAFFFLSASLALLYRRHLR